MARSAGGLLLAGLTACGGPALTPLQSQYQRETERALRYHARGELPRALAASQESLRWAEVADDRPAMVTQALNVGALALALGDWTLAERSFQRAQSMAMSLSDVPNELRARLGLARSTCGKAGMTTRGERSSRRWMTAGGGMPPPRWWR